MNTDTRPTRDIRPPKRAQLRELKHMILPAALIPVRHAGQYTESTYSSLTIAVLRAAESSWSPEHEDIVDVIDVHREYFAGIPSSAEVRS